MNGSSFPGNMRPCEAGVAGVLFRQPFYLGPFSVDVEGRLSPARDDAAPRFSVRWRGRLIHARLSGPGIGDGRLYIRSILGRIPSTVSDAAARVACFTMLGGLSTQLPAAWSVRLLPDHQSLLEAESTVALPITVTDLLTEVTSFLLDLSPYLDLMEEAGVSLGAEAAWPALMEP
jgi:hypothetical protein